MEFLDGWAIAVGDSPCRYMARHGHQALEGLFCSKGAYSAGWRLFFAAIFLAIITYVLYRMLRIGP